MAAATLALGALLAPLDACAQEPEAQYRATRDGEWVSVSARVTLPVDAAAVWSVLSDYEAYTRFISSMSESRIVARTPEGVVLEQKSELGALFFVRRVEVRLAVVETPRRSIVSRSLAGSFRDLTGRYELEPVEGGVRLSYTGRWSPDFALPPVLGMAVVRYSLEKHFSEMMAEILRRSAAASVPSSAPASIPPARPRP